MMRLNKIKNIYFAICKKYVIYIHSFLSNQVKIVHIQSDFLLKEQAEINEEN